MAKKNSLEDFSNRMNKRGEAVLKNSVKVQRQVFLAVDTALVTSTPVDTGRARSNWQPSSGSPNLNERGAFTPGEQRSTEAENTNAALQEAASFAAAHTSGGILFLTNNLSYIRALNAGHSPQHSGGFVEESVKAANTLVQGPERARIVDP